MAGRRPVGASAWSGRREARCLAPKPRTATTARRGARSVDPASHRGPGQAARGSGRRRSSPEVRRRRTLLAVMGLLLIALALPLSGTGGYSHPAGSALAENRGPVVYTVQPGDSLWSIAERLDPTADPRPLVARLASQTGSESVRPGERIVLP